MRFSWVALVIFTIIVYMYCHYLSCVCVRRWSAYCRGFYNCVIDMIKLHIGVSITGNGWLLAICTSTRY